MYANARKGALPYLDDEIDGDLIEDGETSNGEVIREVCVFWNVGYQQYVIQDFEKKSKKE